MVTINSKLGFKSLRLSTVKKYKNLSGNKVEQNHGSSYLGGGGGSSESVGRIVSGNVDSASVREGGSW